MKTSFLVFQRGKNAEKKYVPLKLARESESAIKSANIFFRKKVRVDMGRKFRDFLMIFHISKIEIAQRPMDILIFL